MTIRHRLYVGTIGEGLWRSLDSGETFAKASDGMFVECDVRALTVHPGNKDILYLGNEHGVYRSVDGAQNWDRVDSPANDQQIWAIYLLPSNPDVLLVGACPSRIFQSEDAGRSWRLAADQIRKDCPRILHTRVTCFCADPRQPETVFAGVEIDGCYRSQDQGRTWRALGTGLSSQDIHSLAAVPNRSGSSRLLASTNNDLNISHDQGQTWEPMRVGRSLPWSYCRGLAQHCGRPEIVLMGNGNGPPGSEGVVARSEDGGSTWRAANMPARSNSTIWNFAVNAADPDLIYASSVSGQIHRSIDGGISWDKLAREFGEVRALAWTPE